MYTNTKTIAYEMVQMFSCYWRISCDIWFRQESYSRFHSLRSPWPPTLIRRFTVYFKMARWTSQGRRILRDDCIMSYQAFFNVNDMLDNNVTHVCQTCSEMCQHIMSTCVNMCQHVSTCVNMSLTNGPLHFDRFSTFLRPKSSQVLVSDS